MPRIAIPPGRVSAPAAANSFELSPEILDLSQPLTGLEAVQLAEQLIAGYGVDALRLAKRRTAQLFEEGSAEKFADWCLVVVALEEMAGLD